MILFSHVSRKCARCENSKNVDSKYSSLFFHSKTIVGGGKNKYMIRSNFQYRYFYYISHAMMTTLMMVDMQYILKAFCCVIESSTTGLNFFFAASPFFLYEQTRMCVWRLCLTSKHDFHFFFSLVFYICTNDNCISLLYIFFWVFSILIENF